MIDSSKQQAGLSASSKAANPLPYNDDREPNKTQNAQQTVYERVDTGVVHTGRLFYTILYTVYM